MASDKTSVDTTSVCNVRVQYIRPAYPNLKEWMKDDRNVYIGRAGIVFCDGVRFPPQPSEWANPFKLGKDGDRATVLQKYEAHVRGRLANDPAMQERLHQLSNKRLGCWCVPKEVHADDVIEDEQILCHGQILLKLRGDV